MSTDIKSASLSGLLYRFMERILAQLVSTVVTIILARILMPEDYGVVSLLVIILTICNVLVTDGLSSALLQKKEPNQVDYSTIFWGGLTVSIAIYVLLFFFAPIIASYFDHPNMVPLFRVMLLQIPIASINSTQSAFVSKNYLFRKFFFATLTGTIVSGIFGIVLAYEGYGPWALVVQYLTNSLIDTAFLFCSIKWVPNMIFSWKAFIEMFSFGWKILVSGLIGELYEELRSVIIAKQYSTKQLSFYTKGKQFPQLLGDNISSTITNVMFPIYSTAQDEPEKLKNMVRISLATACYVLCPLLIGFSVMARQFVVIVLTEKWLESVLFIKIFSIMYIFKPLKNINKSALKAMRRSDLDLYVNIFEKTLGIVLILIFMNQGTIPLAISALITYFAASVMNMSVCGKLLKYSLFQQIKDIWVFFFFAVISCIPAWFLDRLLSPTIWCLILQIVSGCIIYIILSKVFHLWVYDYMKTLLISKIKQHHVVLNKR